MKPDRRDFLKTASLGAAYLAAGNGSRTVRAQNQQTAGDPGGQAYKYRIAFGAWINDMRQDPLPLENWPAPQFDDECVGSIIKTMDVQSKAGFNMLDVWGLFATYGWPTDIVSALDDDRKRRIHKLLAAARERGIQIMLGLGTYSWGYDKIIQADPAVRGKNPDGSPHAHAMCDAGPKAFEYVRKIIDFTLGEFDFGGVHLESCDLGCCHCPQCAGKDGVVGYNVRINTKTADYVKRKWPDKTVYVITINWIPAGKHFNADEKARVIELSKHIDCVFDQGHCGCQVAENERRDFIRSLHCAYGTSGQLWLYPDAKWDRSSYFLPYTRRSGHAIKKQYEDGVRGCMFYQGPVNNPSTEVNVAVGGRILSDTGRNPDDVLAEVIDLYYKPKDAETRKLLVDIFRRAEDGYFGQWKEEAFRKVWGIPTPGEFKLDQALFGTAPGAATYLREPSLDAQGRKAYKKVLLSILADLPKLEGKCQDEGRLKKIKSGVIVTLNLISTIAYCQGET
jgi:hypothetical protein